MHTPTVLIFNGRLLLPSETFIKAQAESLKKFSPYYVGARRVVGLPLASERALVVNKGGPCGKAAEYLFKQTGLAPHLSRQLKPLKPQLIHAHFGVCGTLALPLATMLKVPLIVTFHGFDASMTDDYARRSSITTRVYLRRRDQLKHKASRFIAVSDFIKGKLVKQGFPEDKICVHYIGIDTDRFQPDPTIERRPAVLFVGRLVEKKGCEYLIRAMSAVQQQVPDAELVIIGDGPLRHQLEILAGQTLKNYRFLGLQTPDQVKTWMNQACLLAAPSVTTVDGDTEGLPMVILEAQSMELPVVSSYHAGIPEAIIDGETGFLVSERATDTLSKQILNLFLDPNLWQKFSLAGQQRIRTNFNLRRQNQLLEQIYQDVINQSLKG